MNQYALPQNQTDLLKPKKHHGYAVILFIMGTLFPPLAVAARFGIGSDFWLNLLLTICGYIPGHGHNFYIQNVRNNKNHARTPKWIQKYGLVDTSEIRRKERKSQWSHRYNDRNPHSTLENQPLEEGQRADRSTTSLSSEGHDRRGGGQDGDLWRPEDESYYNNSNTSTETTGRWRYPANFDDAAFEGAARTKRSKKKDKKDRWARTEDAYAQGDGGKNRKKSKKKKKNNGDASSAASVYSQDSNSMQYPEDPERAPYASASGRADEADRTPEPLATHKTGDEVFRHEF
ncbi:hypothetical protein DL96DRAFT_1703275 [Flagelloscypha sp. PMI_526]|nr:hypothetical protein DL96DRAFT_1703275 [Flagelloscypha sp. PMI_526]